MEAAHETSFLNKNRNGYEEVIPSRESKKHESKINLLAMQKSVEDAGFEDVIPRSRKFSPIEFHDQSSEIAKKGEKKSRSIKGGVFGNSENNLKPICSCFKPKKLSTKSKAHHLQHELNDMQLDDNHKELRTKYLWNVLRTHVK